MLRLTQPHSVMQNSILSAPITSLQGIYDLVTLHVHIMCQDTHAGPAFEMLTLPNQ